jgi:hypothetical protein
VQLGLLLAMVDALRRCPSIFPGTQEDASDPALHTTNHDAPSPTTLDNFKPSKRREASAKFHPLTIAQIHSHRLRGVTCRCYAISISPSVQSAPAVHSALPCLRLWTLTTGCRCSCPPVPTSVTLVESPKYRPMSRMGLLYTLCTCSAGLVHVSSPG